MEGRTEGREEAALTSIITQERKSGRSGREEERKSGKSGRDGKRKARKGAREEQSIKKIQREGNRGRVEEWKVGL